MAAVNDIPPAASEQPKVEGGSVDVGPSTVRARLLGRLGRRGIIAAGSAVVVLAVGAVSLALVPRSGEGPPGAAGPSRTSETGATADPTTTVTASVGPTTAGTPGHATTPGGAASSGSGPRSTLAPLPPPGGGNAPAGLPRPAAPSNLVAEVVDSTRIRLRWMDNANNEAGYTIVKDDGKRVDLPANTTSYLWSGLARNASSCFAIGGYNASGWSSDPFPPASGQDWVCSQTPLPQKPTAPVNLTAVQTNYFQVTLRWTSTTLDVTDFGVLIMDGQQNAIGDASVAQQDRYDYEAVIDVPVAVETGVVYCFKVSARNLISGASVWGNVACTSFQPVPANPSGLQATVTGTTIHLQWTDNSAIETSYQVISEPAGSHGLPPNATSDDWTGLAPGTKYCFWVIAGNALGYYSSGTPACATTAS